LNEALLARLAGNFSDKRINQIALFVCVLFLPACSVGNTVSQTIVPSSPKPTATSTVMPPTATPTLTPAFVSGFADIPPGKYLFVEYWNDTRAQELVEGTCQPMAIDFPNYSFDTQTRKLTGLFNWGQVKPPNSLKGFFGRGQSLQGKAGIGIYSGLEPIISLPHQSLYRDRLIINGVNKDGTIVIEVEGHIERLEPNKSWTNSITSEATPGCQRTTTMRFTNYGLLEKSQIDLH
jgi:hypothetical protein